MTQNSLPIKDCGSNNIFEIYNITASNSSIKIFGSNNKIQIEDDVVLNFVQIIINGDHCNLKIQKKTTFKSGATFTLQNRASILIGRRVSAASDFEVIANGANITIDHDCMIARGVCLRSSDMHSIFDISTGKKINKSNDIIVNRYVWLCRNATILKGVTIGSGSVVGCESVLTKNVPECCIAAGNPAKIVKQNIIWSFKDLANNLKDANTAKRYLKAIKNIEV